MYFYDETIQQWVEASAQTIIDREVRLYDKWLHEKGIDKLLEFIKKSQ